VFQVNEGRCRASWLVRGGAPRRGFAGAPTSAPSRAFLASASYWSRALWSGLVLRPPEHPQRSRGGVPRLQALPPCHQPNRPGHAGLSSASAWPRRLPGGGFAREVRRDAARGPFRSRRNPKCSGPQRLVGGVRGQPPPPSERRRRRARTNVFACATAGDLPRTTPAKNQLSGRTHTLFRASAPYSPGVEPPVFA